MVMTTATPQDHVDTTSSWPLEVAESDGCSAEHDPEHASSDPLNRHAHHSCCSGILSTSHRHRAYSGNTVEDNGQDSQL